LDKTKPDAGEFVELDEVLAAIDLQPIPAEDEGDEDSKVIAIEKLEGYLRVFAGLNYRFCAKRLDQLDHLELQALVGMLLGSNESPLVLDEEMREIVRKRSNFVPPVW
jgi:hypothetical protein